MSLDASVQVRLESQVMATLAKYYHDTGEWQALKSASALVRHVLTEMAIIVVEEEGAEIISEDDAVALLYELGVNARISPTARTLNRLERDGFIRDRDVNKDGKRSKRKRAPRRFGQYVGVNNLVNKNAIQVDAVEEALKQWAVLDPESAEKALNKGKQTIRTEEDGTQVISEPDEGEFDPLALRAQEALRQGATGQGAPRQSTDDSERQSTNEGHNVPEGANE